MNGPTLMRSQNTTPNSFVSELLNRSIRPLSAPMIVRFSSHWHVRAIDHLSWTTFASFVLFIFVYLAHGHSFLVATADQNRAGLFFQFLCGFFLFNNLLIVLSLISPVDMFVNIFILPLGALGLAALGLMRQPNIHHAHTELPRACILVSGVAATLWCSDSQMLSRIQGQVAIYHNWQDTFFHVRVIGTFAQAYGIGTIHDIKLSGALASTYYFASYLSAAAVLPDEISTYSFPVQKSVSTLTPGISVSSWLLIASSAIFLLATLSWHIFERRALGLNGFYIEHTKNILSYGRTRQRS